MSKLLKSWAKFSLIQCSYLSVESLVAKNGAVDESKDVALDRLVDQCLVLVQVRQNVLQAHRRQLGIVQIAVQVADHDFESELEERLQAGHVPFGGVRLGQLLVHVLQIVLADVFQVVNLLQLA